MKKKKARYLFGHDSTQDCVYGKKDTSIPPEAEACYTMSLSAAKRGAKSLRLGNYDEKDTRKVYRLVEVKWK